MLVYDLYTYMQTIFKISFVPLLYHIVLSLRLFQQEEYAK